MTARDVEAAEELARQLLDASPERVRHSAAVVARAVSLAGVVDDDDVNLLIASAWLHDVGYSPAVHDTGFHPVDGARFLRSMHWDSRVCALVAHHSGSRFIAAHRGLTKALNEFRYAEGPVSDALTIADQAVGPNGRRFTLEERMRDVLRRHGPDSPQAQAHQQRSAYIHAASRRVDARLATSAVGTRQADQRASRDGEPAPESRLLLPPRTSS